MPDRPTIPPPPRLPAVAVSRLEQILDKLEDLRVVVARMDERQENDRDDLKELKAKVEGVAADLTGLKAKAAMVAAGVSALVGFVPELLKLLGK